MLQSNPSKSALEIALWYLTSRGDVGVWISNIRVRWLAALNLDNALNRVTIMTTLSKLSLPSLARQVQQKSIRELHINLLCGALETSSWDTGTAQNVSHGQTKSKIDQVLGCSDYVGGSVLEALSVADDRCLILCAVCMSAGDATQKAAATFRLLDQHLQQGHVMHATDLFVDTLSAAAKHLVQHFAAQIHGICGGGSEPSPQNNDEFSYTIRSAIDSVLAKHAKGLKKIAKKRSASLDHVVNVASSQLQSFFNNLGACWIPLLDASDYRSAANIGLPSAGSIGTTAGKAFGTPQWEIGKATALLSATGAHQLAISLGCTSNIFIRRMVFLFATRDGTVSGVWAREFAAALLILSNGHHDDKRFGLLTIYGMAGTRHTWSTETRQWRQDELFRALRPLLVIAMDAAVGHISLLAKCFGLTNDWCQIVLQTLNLRTMLWVENLCRRLSAAPATAVHQNANQQLLLWFDYICRSWLQLWTHWFTTPSRSRSDDIASNVIPAAEQQLNKAAMAWPHFLRPDSVGYSAGAVRLMRARLN
jgi:hypothetical protein